MKTDPNLPTAMASGAYGYNTEGQLNGVYALIGSSVLSESYSFDTMGRLSGMTGGATVTGVTYNAAGQMTQATFNGLAEAWSYNERNQVTRHIVSGQMDIGYQYSATQNNGQIEARLNYLSGETVTYTYGSLNRLISASTNGPDWGFSFSYDGFGNRTAQTLTKGSGPPNSSLAFDANNRVERSQHRGLQRKLLQPARR